MTALTPPAADAPAEEWGALAVSIPDWRWMTGMLNRKDGPRYMGSARWAWDEPYRHHAQGIADDDWPDPDDPATAGCLLALLGSERHNVTPGSAIAADGRGWWAWVDGEYIERMTLGRACIAAAAALGRWPGGAS